MGELTSGAALRKAWRFVTIYGLGKTIFKIFGRLRPKGFLAGSRGVRDIGLIGCGQFGYATIGYSIWRRYRNRFVSCYDINKGNQQSFANFFGLNPDTKDASEVMADDRVKVVYIASNHASHSSYAITALLAGKAVYLEKPISVSLEQLHRLLDTVRITGGTIFAGYNRPFSAAVRKLRGLCGNPAGPLTLNCFVSGHVLGPDHWYRLPQEGTRICGNVGHWLDLAVHMLSWGELPNRWRVALAYGNDIERDDNVAISLTSDRGDLVNIVLTSRIEPFEGINETINFQQGDVIAKIDDFRRMTVWKGTQLNKYKFWPKDVGHNLAILQPFSEARREWREVIHSTVLMLFIAEMVAHARRYGEFSFSEVLAKIESDGDQVTSLI